MNYNKCQNCMFVSFSSAFLPFVWCNCKWLLSNLIVVTLYNNNNNGHLVLYNSQLHFNLCNFKFASLSSECIKACHDKLNIYISHLMYFCIHIQHLYPTFRTFSTTEMSYIHHTCIILWQKQASILKNVLNLD